MTRDVPSRSHPISSRIYRLLCLSAVAASVASVPTACAVDEREFSEYLGDGDGLGGDSMASGDGDTQNGDGDGDGDGDSSGGTSGNGGGGAGAGPAICAGTAPSEITPYFPMTGTYTGSLLGASNGALRPRFAWTPVEGDCDVTYRIQMDDSCPSTNFSNCKFESPELDEDGLAQPEFQVTTNLKVSSEVPVGTRYFWRVRACDGEQCGPWSSVRYLDVGRSRADIDGDGYDDLVVESEGAYGLNGDGQFHFVMRGTASPPGPLAVDFWPDSEQEPTYLGDIDADGFADFVMPGEYEADIYHGGVDYLGSSDASFNGYISMVTDSAGDFDGDGAADLLLSWWDENASSEIDITHRLTFGQANRMYERSDLLLAEDVGTDKAQFRQVGDINRDGYVDVAGFVENDLSLRLFLGGPSADSVPDKIITVEDVESCGNFVTYRRVWVMGAGDMSGDGIDDFVLACGGGPIHVIEGALDVSTLSAERLSSTVVERDTVGGADINGDGLGEILLPSASGTTVQLLVKNGGSYVVTAFLAPNFGSQFATEMTLLDLNGDALTDLISGNTWFAGKKGAAPAAGVDLEMPLSTYSTGLAY